MRFYFYRGKGFWAAMIRWFTRSKYAHMAVAFDDGAVFESVPGKGVIQGRLKSVDGVTPFVYTPDARPDSELGRRFCEAELGAGYDYWGCICFILGVKQRCSASRYFCSEYGALAALAAGVPLQERVETFKLSPDMCAMSPVLNIDFARKFQWAHAGRYL